jgi:hypothetical protein
MSHVRLPTSGSGLLASNCHGFSETASSRTESIFPAAGVSRLNHAIPLENNGRTFIMLLQFEPEF